MGFFGSDLVLVSDFFLAGGTLLPRLCDSLGILLPRLSGSLGMLLPLGND